MEEVRAVEPLLDLRDLEMKTGYKIPAGLMAWMREDPARHGERECAHEREHEHEPAAPERAAEDTGTGGLAEKIKGLKEDMVSLRSADVRILRQLAAVHEGIESLRWLMEERGTLTSRCSSLTSSQYSLAEGPDASLRGSWSSLPDPGDRLDNISVGSYLDTLADDLDENCVPSSEPVLSSTPMGPVTTGQQGTKEEVQTAANPVMETPKATETGRRSAFIPRDSGQTKQSKSNGFQDQGGQHTTFHESARTCVAEKHSKSVGSKSYQSGMINLEGCQLSGKTNLEYDAHCRWVQSQNDVTFL